jgi:hypothetical protein
MKKLLVVAAIAMTPVIALAQSTYYVSPYVKSDGTLVQGHMKTTPNAYRYDNLNAMGSTNTYTGKAGTQRNEFSNPPAYNKSYSGGYNYYTPHKYSPYYGTR